MLETIFIKRVCDMNILIISFALCSLTTLTNAECGINAVEYGDQCRCKENYCGNPDFYCEDACTCTASGDSHFHQYDGQELHFHGPCRYTLSEVVDKNDPSYCSIEIQNEHPGGNSHLTFIRKVYVNVYGKNVLLDRNGAVYYEGHYRYLPCEEHNNQIHIFKSGRFVRLRTEVGLLVSWDGESEVTVQIPRTMGSKMRGICGNCDGKQNDCRTRDGKSLPTSAEGFRQMGQSFVVVTNESPCKVAEVIETCQVEMYDKVNSNEYCGFLNPENPHKNPFSECVAANPDLASKYYKDCRYDCCAVYYDSFRLKKGVCRSLAAFADMCEQRGFIVTWRSENFCPMRCPANMRYSNKVTGCPATCLNLNPDPYKCKLPPTEGCECDIGFVMSGDKCVHKSECGCWTFNGYLPLGTEMYSPDCMNKLKCKMVDGKAKVVSTSVDMKCHADARCGLLMGLPHCVCKKGFFGDGIKYCDPLCNGKTCADNARCRNGKCQCEGGYHGNGYVKCERNGVCDGRTCATNAVCVNYNCVCQEGYIGNGYERCTELCRGRQCAKNAACIKGRCRCNTGFHGNPYLLCEENVKCGGKSCVRNSVCLNYQCVCKEGYYGHGTKYCWKLCGGSKRCAPNSYCHRGECLCRNGYHGNGNIRCEPKGQCDSKDCAANAECVNFVCVCKKGFYGNGYRTCAPLCSGKKCADNANCNSEGKCICNSGYHGDGAIKCERQGVCDGKRCARNAICLNYYCHCKPGYYGDGFEQCTELCNGRKCSKNAYCYRGNCVCNSGYHGNGYIACEPVTMCGGKECAANTHCNNYQCICNDGYVGDGYRECEELCNGKKCAEYAHCGSDGVCRCADGYHGNGYVKCEELNFCGSRRCAANAICVNYVCMCRPGYFGNGLTGCHPLCGGKKCAENAFCERGLCKCRQGYHGDGNVKCEPEMKCGGKECTENAICVNYHCQCARGYTGNGYRKCEALCGGYSVCVDDAECINNKCVCKSGYHGNGYMKCEGLGMCGGRQCVQYAHCYGYKCHCDRGYIGNGYQKCYKLCRNRLCAKYASCVEGKCVCMNGYHGNGYIKCEPTNVCNGQTCAAYSACMNYQCVCSKGYVGNGYRECTPLCGKRKCADNAFCNRRKKCRCLKGHHGNPYIKCEPVGTCGGRVCKEYAECINYQCICRKGFYGNGYIECEKLCGKRRCAKNAFCENGNCVCRKGYHGNGFIKCEADGKCGGLECHKDAKCVNYHCVCKTGFFGNGIRCTPYCSGRKCTQNAFCDNGKCKCNLGYHGNAYYKCEPFGQCDGARCTANAECVNYRCLCKKGFVGNGYKICTELCNGKLCARNSVCEEGKCVCMEGFHGNGYVNCEPTHLCGGVKCGNGAVCVNFKCVCPRFFYGDGEKGCKALCGKTTKCVDNARCRNGKCICKIGYHGDGAIKCEPIGFCGGIQCAENAKCVNYQCQCMKGYVGNGMKECIELCRGHKCVANAFCSRGKCKCVNGYHGNGYIKCEPEDKCGGKSCAVNAICENFQCVCKRGYTGNGYDSCEKLCGGRLCPEYASCNKGSCQCQNGYHGNPYVKCEPVNFCGGRKCAENAVCRNYKCQCKTGFIGYPYRKCTPLCNGRRCPVNAFCEDGKRCKCNEGFHGFPYYKCEPEGLCDGRQCAENAMCVNYVCICRKRFMGDGYKKCSPICGAGICVKDASCVNGTCQCNDGYHGNGKVKCEPIGICGGQECARYAVCEDYKCRCRKGYNGDGYKNCEPEGFCQGQKCANNAVCVNNRCVCKGGYVGDGFHKCEKMCLCSVYGDPHLRSFDGAKFEFVSDCTHTLTKSVNAKSGENFNIEIKNHIPKSSGVSSWARYLDVNVYGNNIRLKPDGTIMCNDMNRYLPISEHKGKLKIYRSGQWVVLHAEFGLVIWWNRQGAIVKVSGSYENQLTGLCGNCNGYAEDDYTGKGGRDYCDLDDAERGMMMGDSYVVLQRDSTKECKAQAVQSPVVVDKVFDRRLRRRYLGMLISRMGPFAKVIDLYPQLSVDLYNSAYHDIYMYFDKKGAPTIKAEEISCYYKEIFAMEASIRGHVIRFRHQHRCPLSCGEHMRYSYKITGCPKTCLDTNPTCSLPTTEGCMCRNGFVESAGQCVKESKCGCTCANGFYLPLGQIITSEDCKTVQKCIHTPKGPTLKVVKTGLKCGPNSICGVSNGEAHCVCLNGYAGDPYTGCQVKSKKIEEVKQKEIIVPVVSKPKALVHKASVGNIELIKPSPEIVPKPKVPVKKPKPETIPEVLSYSKPSSHTTTLPEVRPYLKPQPLPLPKPEILPPAKTTIIPHSEDVATTVDSVGSYAEHGPIPHPESSGNVHIDTGASSSAGGSSASQSGHSEHIIPIAEILPTGISVAHTQSHAEPPQNSAGQSSVGNPSLLTSEQVLFGSSHGASPENVVGVSSFGGSSSLIPTAEISSIGKESYAKPGVQSIPRSESSSSGKGYMDQIKERYNSIDIKSAVPEEAHGHGAPEIHEVAATSPVQISVPVAEGSRSSSTSSSYSSANSDGHSHSASNYDSQVGSHSSSSTDSYSAASGNDHSSSSSSYGAQVGSSSSSPSSGYSSGSGNDHSSISSGYSAKGGSHSSPPSSGYEAGNGKDHSFPSPGNGAQVGSHLLSSSGSYSSRSGNEDSSSSSGYGAQMESPSSSSSGSYSAASGKDHSSSSSSHVAQVGSHLPSSSGSYSSSSGNDHSSSGHGVQKGSSSPPTSSSYSSTNSNDHSSVSSSNYGAQVAAESLSNIHSGEYGAVGPQKNIGQHVVASANNIGSGTMHGAQTAPLGHSSQEYAPAGSSSAFPKPSSASVSKGNNLFDLGLLFGASSSSNPTAEVSAPLIARGASLSGVPVAEGVHQPQLVASEGQGHTGNLFGNSNLQAQQYGGEGQVHQNKNIGTVSTTAIQNQSTGQYGGTANVIVSNNQAGGSQYGSDGIQPAQSRDLQTVGKTQHGIILQQGALSQSANYGGASESITLPGYAASSENSGRNFVSQQHLGSQQVQQEQFSHGQAHVGRFMPEQLMQMQMNQQGNNNAYGGGSQVSQIQGQNKQYKK